MNEKLLRIRAKRDFERSLQELASFLDENDRFQKSVAYHKELKALWADLVIYGTIYYSM